jgi:large subunit ribosomal protein L21
VYAVISDRGRQARVSVGDVLNCDYNEAWKPGDTVVFDQVLLVSNEGAVKVGAPTLTGAKVRGEVVVHGRGVKVVSFRFKRRKNVRVKRGQRACTTRVLIQAIEA